MAESISLRKLPWLHQFGWYGDFEVGSWSSSVDLVINWILLFCYLNCFIWHRKQLQLLSSQSGICNLRNPFSDCKHECRSLNLNRKAILFVVGNLLTFTEFLYRALDNLTNLYKNIILKLTWSNFWQVHFYQGPIKNLLSFYRSVIILGIR